ncbi:MAG: ferritin family protein [Nitrospirota bacterium]
MSNLVDVFKQALRNETKARAFYHLASEVTQNDENRMLFIELAGFEENHARQLVDMAQGVSFEEDWDAEAYLDELESDTHASIPDHELHTILDSDMAKVLKLAREMELSSLNAYRTLADGVTDDKVRDYFLTLADQESQHLAQVERMALALDMDESDRAAL